MNPEVLKLKEVLKLFQINLQLLREYIEFNKKEENAHYNQFRPIVYSGIINRAYSSWETYTKDVFYEYFQIKKKEFIKNETFIKRYKIHDLPAYILENLTFDSENETFSIKVTKDLLVFTGKNVDIKELNTLFKRIDFDIVPYLDRATEITEFIEIKGLPLSNKENNENKIARAIKYIIFERNRTAHNSSIDDYYSIDTLEDWINLLESIGILLCEKLLLYYFEKTLADEVKKNIGKCVTVYNENIGCFDIEEEIHLDKNTLIFVYKGVEEKEQLVNVLLSTGFKINNVDSETVKPLEQVGCNFNSLIFEKTNVKGNHKYYIFDEVMLKQKLLINT